MSIRSFIIKNWNYGKSLPYNCGFILELKNSNFQYLHSFCFFIELCLIVKHNSFSVFNYISSPRYLFYLFISPEFCLTTSSGVFISRNFISKHNLAFLRFTIYYFITAFCLPVEKTISFTSKKLVNHEFTLWEMRVCGKKVHIFQINNKQLSIKMKAGIQSLRKSWSKSSSFIEFTEWSIRFVKKFCLWIWKLYTEVLKMRQRIFALNRAQ